jgi:hypothetical protein
MNLTSISNAASDWDKFISGTELAVREGYGMAQESS